MEHEVTVSIDASPERVWAVLHDVAHWSEWTASITSVELLDGSLDRPGARAKVKQPGFPAVVWTVDDWKPDESFSWSNSSPGVKSVGDHELTPAADGTTDVTLRIRQTGALAGLMRLLYGGRTRRYVGMEAAGLKQRVEASPTP